MRVYLFLTIGFILFGCKSINKLDEITVTPEDLQHEEDPQIVFLYFEIEKKEGVNLEVRLMDTQISEGRMKENTIRQAPKTEGNLLVQLLNEKDQVLKEQVINNPLTKTIEQYSEDGEIISTYLELEETQFFIRFNHKNTIKTIKIYSIQSGAPIEIYHKPLQI